MKLITALTITCIAFCSFADEQEVLLFSTLPECKEYSLELIQKFDTTTTQQLYVELGLVTEKEADENASLQSIEDVKSVLGEFQYAEQIGTISLGTYLTKIGYIVKYEYGTFFCELKIGRPTKSEFQIIGLQTTGKTDDDELMKKIPAGYWK